MSKSRPLYAPFALAAEARAHLVVTDQPAPPPALDLAHPDLTVWTVQTIAPGIPAMARQNLRPFRAVAELLAHLAHRLARETIGLRLYAVGTESFLWDICAQARAAGLEGEEIRLTRAGPLTRRVYCTHCKTLIEDVAQTIVPCPACAAHLFVRDHFSRRLAAFMGVKADAERPGEAPHPEFFAP